MSDSFRKVSFSFIIIISLAIISSCSKKDDSPVVPAPAQESTIKTIATNETASVSTASGLEIRVVQGSVPPNQDNSNAKVTFSIESPVDPPVPIPAGAAKVGNIVRFGPDAFFFRWPVRVFLPYPTGANTGTLKILHYDAAKGKWFIVPASFIDVNKKLVGTDVLELGYYVLASISTAGKKLATDSQGGFEYGGEIGFYYTLTVQSVTFKYPGQAPWFDLVGKVAGSSGTDLFGPMRPTHAILPQGTYMIWITKTKPGTLFELPKQWTWTIPASGTIDMPLEYWGLGNETGWTQLTLPGGGDWVEGIPSNWPQPTRPMGTGEFQATLTWINTSSRYADMDLHLYGPDNMHVYWNDDVSGDASLQLDRDWMSASGNAVENIFSVSQIPKGNYTVKVNNFSGDQMSFNLRVIRFGSVKTYTGTQGQTDGETTYATFSVN